MLCQVPNLQIDKQGISIAYRGQRAQDTSLIPIKIDGLGNDQIRGLENHPLFRSHRPRPDRRRTRGWAVPQGPGAGGPGALPAAGKDAGTSQQPRSESG